MTNQGDLTGFSHVLRAAAALILKQYPLDASVASTEPGSSFLRFQMQRVEKSGIDQNLGKEDLLCGGLVLATLLERQIADEALDIALLSGIPLGRLEQMRPAVEARFETPKTVNIPGEGEMHDLLVAWAAGQQDLWFGLPRGEIVQTSPDES
jgi:hypothetical protein